MSLTRAGTVALLAATVVCLATSGCGDGPSVDKSDDTAFVEGTPEDVATQVATVLAMATKKGDCAPIDRINERSAYDFACPASPPLRESLREFEVVNVERHGSAAIVDYRSGAAPEGASMILNVKHPERRWAVSRFGVLNDVARRRGDRRTRAGYDRAVKAYLRAIRTGDCEAYTRHAASLDGSDPGPCREDFEATRPFRRLLGDNPGTDPRYMGGNDLFGFYALDLDKPLPNPVTITTIRWASGDGSPYRVLSAVPGAVTADR
jgi:hypothetical protein